jgi:hypothetical protein
MIIIRNLKFEEFLFMKKFLTLAFVAVMMCNNVSFAADESRWEQVTKYVKQTYDSLTKSIEKNKPSFVSNNPKISAAIGVATLVGCYYLYKAMCANCTWFARVTGRKIEKTPEMKQHRK